MASNDDILWVRPAEETKAMYGAMYRPGRVSGTEKNRLRRIEKDQGRRGRRWSRKYEEKESTRG